MSIETTTARITQFITETFPTVDLAPGSAINELVVKLSSTVQDQLYTEISTLNQGASFAQAQASTTDTYTDVITNMASNYLVSRNSGMLATGNLKVSYTNNYDKYIQADTIFVHTATGLTYTNTTAYQASATLNTTGYLNIYKQSEGVYYILIPVVATAVGSAYQVSNGSTFSLQTSNSFPNLVNITAFGNFTSGKNAESDKEVIARISSSLTNKGMTSELSILSKLSSVYPSVRAVSIVGAGDVEMTRSKQNAFGINTFGMADVYVRTTNGVNSTTLVVSGTKSSTGVWMLYIDYSVLAGFYNVTNIQPDNSNYVGTIAVTNTAYGYSSIVGEVNNTLNNSTEARYTQYQICTLTLAYSEPTIVSIGDTQNFYVTFSTQPYIRECQTILNDRTTRIAAADYLVKSAIPCFVSLLVRLEKKTNTTVDVNLIKQDIFNYINGLEFGADIYASSIIDICHNYKNVKRVVTPISMTGLLLAPDGTSATITATDVLSVDGAITGITSKMTGFFTSYGADNSGVSVELV